MQLRRFALWLVLVVGGCVRIASAQTVTLTESNLKDAAGSPFTGQVQICPVLASGIGTWFHFGNGGLGLNRCATVNATNGAFSATVPDTYTTTPQNLLLAVHAWDPVTNSDDLNIEIQPSNQAGSPAVTNGWCAQGGSCNLDNWSAAVPSLPETNLNLTVTGSYNGGNTFSVPVTATSFNSTNGNAKLYDAGCTGCGGLSLNGITVDTANNFLGVGGYGAEMIFGVPAGGAYAFLVGGTPLAAGCAQLATGGIFGTASLPCALYGGAYSAGTTYAAGVIVTYDGTFYLSLVGSNTGNTPGSSPSAWASFGSNSSGSVTVNGHNGPTITLAAQDVGASQAPDAGSRFAQLANNLLKTDHFYFSDGTNGWWAGETYTSAQNPTFGMYGEDTMQTMLAYPGYFSAADFLNYVNKFIANKKVAGDGNPSTLQAGDFPQTIKQNGTAGQFCGSLDAYCHYAEGGGRIGVPLVLYLYWQRTGDLTPYTANVAAIKTALAIPPVDSNGLVYVTAGQEDIPNNGYFEYMRGLGDLADANVWMCWDYKALALMAAAAGDSTNATFFNGKVSAIEAGLVSQLTDPSGLLLFANGSQDKRVDIADSSLAIYPLLGAANGILLPGSQATQISTWLNTNYSSLVNAAGYVKLINVCDTVGGIGSNGGAPYTSFDGNSLTGYQCGYWSTFGGYFAYALSLTNPAQASTYLSTYINGASGMSATTEYYNQGSTTPQGDPALMTTAQTMRMASDLFPTPPASVTGVSLAGAPTPTLGASCSATNTILAADSTHLYVCTGGVVAAATLTGPTWTAPTYVNACTNTVSSSSTTTVTCSLTPTAGDFAVVDCRGTISVGGSYTATSSPSASFSQLAYAVTSGGSSQVSYAFNQTGGSTTYSCTGSASNTYQTIEVVDYHPGSITSLATSAINTITSATGSYTSTSINTTGASFVISIADPQFAPTAATVGTIDGSAANNRTINTSANSQIEDLSLSTSATGITGTMTASPTGTWTGTILALH